MKHLLFDNATQRANNINFCLRWVDESEGVSYTTLAAMKLVIDDLVVWPVLAEHYTLDWFADEFLAHLVECWKPILIRQTYPIDVRPARPSLLRAEAEKRWSTMPEEIAQNEDEAVAAFEDVHNLANAFAGISGIEDLWIFRERETFLVETSGRLWSLDWEKVVSSLTDAGDEIARRLSSVGNSKWSKLIQAWRDRDRADGIRVLQLSTGLDSKTVRALVAEKLLVPPTSVSSAATDDDELSIAARTAGPLSVDSIKEVIRLVRQCDHHHALELDKMASEATHRVGSVYSSSVRPYDQASAAAGWVREKLSLGPSSRIEPFGILRQLCVDVRLIDVPARQLDAIAVWGPNYGPTVMLNRQSRRFHTSNPRQLFTERGAVRATAAHELCHLLLDKEHTLSAVEVLGNRMPLRIEQRARAFAAEFLVPEAEARRIWEAEPLKFDLSGVRRVLRRIRHTFGVTTSLAGWRLEHALRPQFRQDIGLLIEQVIDRSVYSAFDEG